MASTAAPPMPTALAAVQSDAHVAVETEPWLIFRPTGDIRAVGLVLHPGAWVDLRANAPAAHALSHKGQLDAIVPMPLNLAVLAPDRAARVIAAFPETERWALGGHSVAGAMAARFALQNP